VALAVLAMIAGSFVQHLRTALGHDVAHFLALAKILAGGRTLYDDVLDQNTPAMVGLDLLAVALARATGLAEDHAHTALVTAVTLAGFALACSVVRGLAREDRVLRAGFALCAAATLFVFPGYDYGTREQLFTACFLPYVIAVIAQAQSVERTRLQSAAVALLAGYGVFLKPHFAVFPAVTALWELARSGFSLRALSRETWLLAALLALAYSAFLLLVPEYLDSVVPLMFATFWQYRIGVLPALALSLGTFAFSAGVLVAATLFDRWLPETRLRALLPLGWLYLLAGVALVGAQGFGFSYHAKPLLWMSYLLAGLLCVRAGAIVFTGPTLAPARSRALLVALSLSLAFGAPRAVDDGLDLAPRVRFANHPFVAVLDQNGPNEYAYVLSSSVRPGGWAYVYADTRWSGHMIPMFLLPIVADHARAPSLHPQVAPEAIAEVERYERARILADFRERPPKLVLVDVGARKRYFRTDDFDWLEFLGRDEAFARVWRELDYEAAGIVTDFERRPFAVYRRRDAGSAQPTPRGAPISQLKKRTASGFTKMCRSFQNGECHCSGGSVPSRISAIAPAVRPASVSRICSPISADAPPGAPAYDSSAK
jgi:hypothetical protein